jgi:hypothetical protein
MKERRMRMNYEVIGVGAGPSLRVCLSTVVVLRKCCTVAAPVLPCLKSPEVAV